ncbi:hypothetical protein EDF22_1379 [Rathayibacter sp. PhB127]|uniref:hypothetical protein n=1 Tax=Rathayibacter sp. PhB127 TaxID=2485176 RepID=UPI000F4B6DA2|nr:hypothetical protein [Rathayibacter sp. PhB127]ROS29633.1 hypothetical protein EDF22_1379 [Rathayibacter sp. PhB127]
MLIEQPAERAHRDPPASEEQFPSFVNGPDTGVIGAALSGALVELEFGNVSSADAFSSGLDSARQAVGG